MGLAINTDFLAWLLDNDAEGAESFREGIEVMNKLLVAHGLPAHEEPETAGPASARSHVGGFSYMYLHYLRRAFALVHLDLPVTPAGDDEDPGEDPAILDASSNFDTHLLCHSDCDGFYVPLDFEEAIFDLKDKGLPGEILGSSFRLMAELAEVAPALGIPLTKARKKKPAQLSDEAAAELFEQLDSESPFWRERMVWLALWENARVSIENRCLLVYS